MSEREVWVVENRRDVREPWAVSHSTVTEELAVAAMVDLNVNHPDRVRQVTRYVPAPAPKKAKAKQ